MSIQPDDKKKSENKGRDDRSVLFGCGVTRLVDVEMSFDEDYMRRMVRLGELARESVRRRRERKAGE